MPKLKMKLIPTLDSGVTLRTVDSIQELETLLDEYGLPFEHVTPQIVYVVDDSPAPAAYVDPIPTPPATTGEAADPAAAPDQTTSPIGGE